MNVLMIQKTDIPEHPLRLPSDLIEVMRVEACKKNTGLNLNLVTWANPLVYGFPWGFIESADMWIYVFEPLPKYYRHNTKVFVTKKHLLPYIVTLRNRAPVAIRQNRVIALGGEK